ncbi:MAG: OmpA family protein, partial [Elusimicrobiota bacterium]|nr:OmpA family protein [Elusimicrobiota bacterium]
SILFFFFILPFLAVQTSAENAAGNFDDFASALGKENYNIHLSSYQNPLVFKGAISNIASRGTIRGAQETEKNSVLDGAKNTGFLFDISRDVFFTGGIEFWNFQSYSKYGGALHIAKSAVDFDGSFLFSGNKTGWGGAIYATYSAPSFIGNSAAFKANEAEEHGGAIYIFDMAMLNLSPSSAEFSANSARLGGAVSVGRISTFTANISGTMLVKGNNAQESGGAFYVDTYSSLSLTGGNIVFANNSAGIDGGALWIGSHSAVLIKAAKGGNIFFYGNRAGEKPNDIYIVDRSYLEFSADAGGKINLEGGIKGKDSLIRKTGDGTLYIGADAVVEHDSVFSIEEGRTEIESLDVKIASLTVLPGAQLAFTGKLKHTLTADDFTSNGMIVFNINLRNFESDILKIENYADISSSLYINFYGYGTDIWNPINLIDYPVGGNVKFTNAAGNLKFDLQYDASGQIRLQLLEAPILSNMLPYTSFYANLRTLPLAFMPDYYSLYNRDKFYAKDKTNSPKTESAVWLLGLGTSLNYKESGNSAGNFDASGQGIAAGVDVFEDGGVFFSYQNTSAKQAAEEADMENMEFGAYKRLKIADKTSLNIMGSLGMQSFELQNLPSFNSKTLKLSLEGEMESVVNIFGGLRGGYVAGNKIITEDITMPADGYFKMDAIAGIKKDYKLRSDLIAGAKVYLGFLIAGQDIEFETDQDVPIKGASQDNFFGGAGIKVNWQFADDFGIFGGFNAQTGGANTAYLGYLGLDYKFSSAKTERKKKVKKNKIDFGKAKTFRLPAAYFRTGSYVLSSADKNHIADIAQALKNYRIKKISVEGHTDSAGEASYNMALSRDRARAVCFELIRNGIPKTSIEYTGFFYLLPVSSNYTESGKSANRRADVFVELYSESETDALEDENVEIQNRNQKSAQIKDGGEIKKADVLPAGKNKYGVSEIRAGFMIEEIDLDLVQNVAGKKSAEETSVKAKKPLPQSKIKSAKPAAKKTVKAKTGKVVKKTSVKKAAAKSKKPASTSKKLKRKK